MIKFDCVLNDITIIFEIKLNSFAFYNIQSKMYTSLVEGGG